MDGNNLGFAGGNNLALKHVATEYVALLNPDAFPESAWLETLIAAAEANPVVAAFGSCQMVHSSEDVIDGLGDVYHCSGLVWRDRHGKRLAATQLQPKEIFSACACAALYRTSAICEVGGFDENFFCYVEDIDLGFRLRLAGFKCLLVTDAVVEHIGAVTTGGQHSDFAVYNGHRNLVWAYVKNMPGWLFWLFLPLHFLINMVAIIRFSLSGQTKVILRAKWDAILGLPKMWRARHAIQASRKASILQLLRVLDKRFWLGR